MMLHKHVQLKNRLLGGIYHFQITHCHPFRDSLLAEQIIFKRKENLSYPLDGGTYMHQLVRDNVLHISNWINGSHALTKQSVMVRMEVRLNDTSELSQFPDCLTCSIFSHQHLVR